jgi:DNA-binding SARP family transcriptional activator
VILDYRVLGPFLVTADGVDLTPTAAKVRQVLALMLLRANRVVSVDAIFDELWGDTPPRSAVTTTQTYVYQIRKLLSRMAGAPMADRTMRTVSSGYLLEVEPQRLDSWEFDRQVECGRALLEADRALEAAELLRAALELWRGPVLADVTQGVLLQQSAAELEERRLLGLELRLRADMQLGRHRELLAELKSLVMAHPYHEWFHVQLMIALHRSGRRGEALAAFRTARGLLNEQLGVEPSDYLRRVHQHILEGDALSG